MKHKYFAFFLIFALIGFAMWFSWLGTRGKVVADCNDFGEFVINKVVYKCEPVNPKPDVQTPSGS